MSQNKLPSRILLIGWYGSMNLGDELSLKAVVSLLLKKYGSTIHLIVTSHRPNFTKEFLKILCEVQTIYFFNFLSIVREIIKSDLIVFGSGTLIQNRFKNVLGYSLILLISKFFSKKVIMLSQGFDVDRPILIQILRLILKLPDTIVVRDPNSKKFLLSIKRNKKTLLLPDITFLLFTQRAQREINIKKKTNAKMLGINIRKIDDKFIMQSIETLLSELVKSYQVTLVPFSQSDYYLAERISQKVKNVIVAKLKFDLDYLEELYSSFDIFIGMAYHSLVFSLLFGIPFIIIPYARKCEYFASYVDLPHLVINGHMLREEVLRALNLLENNVKERKQLFLIRDRLLKDLEIKMLEVFE